MFTVVLVIVLLACVVLAWIQKPPSNDDPPVQPGALPIIGHSLSLIFKNRMELWIFFNKLSKECTKLGGVISTTVGPKIKVYCVTDPDDTLTIANTCLEKNFMYMFSKAWVGDGLMTSDATTWKAHRKLLNPAFSQTVLDGFMDVFNGQARRLVKDLEGEVDKGPFNHYNHIVRNALETSFLTVFGLDFTDKILSNKFVHATEEILNVIVARVQNFLLYSEFLFNWSAWKRKQDDCLKILHNVSNTILKRRKANYMNKTKNKDLEEQTGSKCKPFMDLLLELAIEKGAFTDQEIREHVDTMLFASYDTTASTLMFIMLLIGTYPEVQEKLFKELHSVFGDEDRDVTKQDLSQLLYLEAVIKESIRIYPIGPIIARYIDRDIKLKNCTLLKGRTCFLFLFGLLKHPMWGPDAEEFRPDRWLDPTTLPKHPAAFAGFGVGKRNCIGKSYAIMSMKTSLAHIFRQYRVSGDHTKMVLRMDFVLQPVSGHHITIERRKEENTC